MQKTLLKAPREYLTTQLGNDYRKRLEKISLSNTGTIRNEGQKDSSFPIHTRSNQNNKQILVRLENIEHLQRSMVLELYKMKRASPNITHTSPYEGGCSSSHMSKEPLFFNPLGSFMNTYPSSVSFEANQPNFFLFFCIFLFF